ncbi:MAG: alanine racemase [Crocinitomicaceae bacterium]|nr:alanine racemase [Crocinitomicaceae bacterium]
MNIDFSIKELAEIVKGEIYNPLNLSADFSVSNVVIDTRSPSIQEKTLFVALTGSKEDGHKFLETFRAKKGQVAIVSKSNQAISVCQIVVKNPLEALQSLAEKHRSKFTYPVIGITGSNGKTIVKEWLYHVLKDNYSIVRSPKSYNSQIGAALSVLEMNADHSLAIFEAGISKPGEMQKLEKMIQPTIGVFTGIGDAHSANFSSDEQKLEEKKKLFTNCKVLFDNNAVSISEIPFTDEASMKNASLVSQVSAYLGLNEDLISGKLKTLPAISMRLEQLEGKDNCLLLNDSYSADLQSLEIALKQLRTLNKFNTRILFLSAFEENQNDQIKINLRQLLTEENISRLVFIGSKNDLPELKIPVDLFDSADSFLKAGLKFENATILFKGSRKSGLEKIVHHLAEKKHITKLLINFSAVRNNLNFFRSRLSASTKILVMVKAQSYGGGLTEMAHFLVNQKVDYFGVAYADEGVQLRLSGITLPILVMNPEESAFDEILNYNLEPSIYSPEMLNSFLRYLILNQKNHYPVHIKLDTGMNRLGFTENQIKQLLDTLQTQPEVFVKSVFSHLSVADDEAENAFTFNQIRSFDILSGIISDRLPYKFDRHLANSAGAVNFSRAEYDMVRLGIGMFGLVDRNNRELENVLSLITQISQIKEVHAGDSVGYGRTYIATHDHKIGIIPVGYADGLRRGLSQQNWSVIVNGKAAPIIGNICMDMCMINLEGIDASVGDEVEVFGDSNSIFEMAMNLKTIPYEIISSISSRVHRVYTDE